MVANDQQASGSPMFDFEVTGWDDLLNQGQYREYAAGATIYRINENLGGIFYLKQGLIKQAIFTVKGVEKVIDIIKPGCLLGEALFFHNCPSQCTAVSLTDSVVYAFSRFTMEKLLSTHANLMVEIIKSLSFKTRLLTTQIELMASADARTKIGKLLYLLTKDSQRENQVISLTHQALADLVGIHRVTASNILSEFKKEGVIEFQRGNLVVKKAERLITYSYA